MKNLPKGTLSMIHEITGISEPNLSEYVSNNRFPSRSMAIELGDACLKLGLNVTKELWMFGTAEEKKEALRVSFERINNNNS